MGLTKQALLDQMELESWEQFVGDEVELKGTHGECSRCGSTEYEIEALEEDEGSYRYRLLCSCGHRVFLAPDASARPQGQLEDEHELSWGD